MEYEQINKGGANMDNRTYYYARVSSRDQNLARQLEAFRVLGADERSIITDRESGKDLNRPGYMALKNTILRPGDTLVITSLDRLSRRKADIETELLWFREQHIRLKILDLPTTMTDFPAGQEWVADMVNNIIIEVLGTMAEQERLRTRQRQAEGIAVAKAQGVRFGRPPLAQPKEFPAVHQAWLKKEISAREAARRLSVTHKTFLRWAHEL